VLNVFGIASLRNILITGHSHDHHVRHVCLKILLIKVRSKTSKTEPILFKFPKRINSIPFDAVSLGFFTLSCTNGMRLNGTQWDFIFRWYFIHMLTDKMYIIFILHILPFDVFYPIWRMMKIFRTVSVPIRGKSTEVKLATQLVFLFAISPLMTCGLQMPVARWQEFLPISLPCSQPNQCSRKLVVIGNNAVKKPL